MMHNGINSFLTAIFMMTVWKHIMLILLFPRYLKSTKKTEIMRADKIGKNSA